MSFGLTTPLVVAQESAISDESENAEYEVILVTASKRTTGLQETPIAISVTSGDTIEKAKILDLRDLKTLVPTLQVMPLQSSSNAKFAIRGFGNGSNNIGIEPAVGLFIDGVYRSRAAAQIGDLPRVQQVEVLSGPQSTLFGKNASAGVISIRTESPSFSPQGGIEVGIGNYNQTLIKGHYTNGINEEMAYSVSGGVNKRDGYTKSLVGLAELNNRDRWNLRGQFLYEPSMSSKIRFIADYSEIEEFCCTVTDIINGPTTAAVRALGGIVLDESDPFSYTSALNINPNNKIEDGGISMHIDVAYDAFAFTSITAYRHNDASHFADVDYTSLDIVKEKAHTQIDTFTQEFRLTSSSESDFDWMIGAFVIQEDIDTGDTLYFGSDMRNYFYTLGLGEIIPGIESVYGLEPLSTFAEGPILNTEFTQNNFAYSLFFNLDYKISDNLTTYFGASYTHDKKALAIDTVNNETLSAIDLDNDLTVYGVPLSSIDSFAPYIPTLKALQLFPQQLQFPNVVESGKSNDSKVTWSLRLAYELNKNVSFFANAATGFKASSWNLSRDTRPFAYDEAALSAANLIQVNQQYGTRYAKPESSKVYELGLKTRFKSGAFNLTMFDQTIKHFQSGTFVGTGYVLSNAGQQSSKGIEFDANFRATDNITLTLSGVLLDPIYDSYEGAAGVDGPVDLSGTVPAEIHTRTMTAGINYTFELKNGIDGYFRTDYMYENEIRLVSNVPESVTREVSTINASAGVNFENGLSLQLWGRNLNNDKYFISAFPPPIQDQRFTVFPNQPRTFGLSAIYNF